MYGNEQALLTALSAALENTLLAKVTAQTQYVKLGLHDSMS